MEKKTKEKLRRDISKYNRFRKDICKIYIKLDTKTYGLPYMIDDQSGAVCTNYKFRRKYRNEFSV